MTIGVDVWQTPTQYCKAISLQVNKQTNKQKHPLPEGELVKSALIDRDEFR